MVVSEPMFFLLTALADQPRHGYGIMQTVAELSGGRVSLRAGTLYGALERLVAEHLVEVDREEAVDGRLRRYYRITDDGTRLLAGEVARLRENAAVAGRLLKQARLPRLTRTAVAEGMAW